MSFRIKLGPVSLGRTGPRLHLGGRNLNLSTGASGTRGYAKLGPLYWVGKVGR